MCDYWVYIGLKREAGKIFVGGLNALAESNLDDSSELLYPFLSFFLSIFFILIFFLNYCFNDPVLSLSLPLLVFEESHP